MPRRSNSLCQPEILPITQERSKSQTRSETHQEALATVNPTRFRRFSFALTGERSTTLDDLVDSASRGVNAVAAAHEAATLSALASPYPETCVGISDDDRFDSKRVSVSTIIAGQPNTAGLIHSDSGDKSGRSVQKFGMDMSARNDDATFVWHNSNVFPMNPLTSEVIQNYLAALAVESDAEERVPSPSSPPIVSTLTCDNVPGLMKQSVASMTMPVQQIRRAHMSMCNVSNRVHASDDQKHQRGAKSVRYDMPQAFTDYLNSSSCASDAEAWPYRSRGYVSDNPIDEADPRAKELRLKGQRLEADFHRVSRSLPRSPNRTRKSKASGAGLSEALAGFGTSPTSRNISNFDLSHVYDGLPPPKVCVSTNSLNFETFHSTLTPPATPDSSCSVSSVGLDSGSSSGGLSRFLSIFAPFKPKPSNDNPESYIYMDKKTSERRANARASNLISPVSF